MASRSRSRSPKEQPDFRPSGALAKYQRQHHPETSLYAPPRDAASPSEVWTLFTFKGDDELAAQPLGSQSYCLLGADRACHVRTLHPSCSSRHAVIQFRRRETQVRPYLMDLESRNGTSINGEKLDAARFYELRSGDLIRVGQSTRDYVLVQAPTICNQT